MKTTFALLLTTLSLSAFAAPFKLTCYQADTKIEINDLSLEIFSQNEVESSLIAEGGYYQFNDEDGSLIVNGKYLAGSEAEVKFPEGAQGIGSGFIVYPYSKKKLALTDCTLKKI